MMASLRDLGLTALEIALLLVVVTPSAYLGLLAILSRRPRSRPGVRGDPATRLVVLIAAHDEEAALPETLRALREANGERPVVHVMADNCSDHTADVARAAGACVHERHDAARRGKAAALNTLTREVIAEDVAGEAYLVIDADSRLDPGFVTALTSALDSEVEVVQAANLVEVSSAAPLRLIRDLAFHLRCELRPLAYARLGVSAELFGNGMCFRRRIVERFSWSEQSVVEDGDLHLRLVAAGVRVRFASEAVVRSVMPAEFRGATGQALRWERGKFDLLGAGVRTILTGLITRRKDLVVAGYGVLIPPFSFLVAAAVASVLVGVLADPALTAIGLATLFASGIYVARGAALAKIGARELVTIGLWAPAYVGWKLTVLARAFVGDGRGHWAQARRIVPALSSRDRISGGGLRRHS